MSIKDNMTKLLFLDSLLQEIRNDSQKMFSKHSKSSDSGQERTMNQKTMALNICMLWLEASRHRLDGRVYVCLSVGDQNKNCHIPSRLQVKFNESIV
jgi:hypothetical protein